MSFNTGLIKIQFIVDHLSFPHRVALLCGLILMIFTPWYFLVYEPQAEAATEVQQEISDLKNKTAELQANYNNILLLSKNHEVGKLIVKYKALDVKLHDLHIQVLHFHNRYISDKELAAMLHSILENMHGVKIEKFVTLVSKAPEVVESKTKPVAAAGKINTPPPASQTSNLPEVTHYSLALKGDYFSILQFLQHVEQLKWQLFWDKFDYHVEHYPIGIATIEFYTLEPQESLDNEGEAKGVIK